MGGFLLGIGDIWFQLARKGKDEAKKARSLAASYSQAPSNRNRGLLVPTASY